MAVPPVFRPPALTPVDLEVIGLIDGLRDAMRDRVAEPQRWAGSLRRMALARAVQGSNSIEGYNASLDDVAAAVDDEPVLDADEETQAALTGYRDAMTYVLQIAQDDAVIDEGLVKALHFMMIKHDISKSPGRWRLGEIFVHREETDEIVYTGPDSADVPTLIASMLDRLERSTDPVFVRAAMAHLNLVMVHPFRDGNGRMARCLQTLVLARDRIVAPVFSSIEEYLGRNTQAYYDVLAEVGRGAWHPENDARPWVEFCLTAHYRQARTHLRRIEEIEELWRRYAKLAAARRLPERSVGGLIEAAYGFRVRNAVYRIVVESTDGEAISELTASRDLKAMTEAGLLQAVGEKRGRYYLPSDELVELRHQLRAARPPRSEYDPFEVVRGGRQLSLIEEPNQ
jgi:Fic family protein